MPRRRITVRGGAALTVVATLIYALAPLGCEGRYTEPPTACDDYCRASQRANCEEDWPDDCVSDCENDRSGVHAAACEPIWRSLSACLLEEPASAFYCEQDHSQPRAVCLELRADLADCAAPAGRGCFETCLRRAETCGESSPGCERSCYGASRHCAEEFTSLYRCLASFPVECEPAPRPDLRKPEDIPCLAEIGAVLACNREDAGSPEAG